MTTKWSYFKIISMKSTEVLKRVMKKATDNGWPNEEGFTIDIYDNLVSSDDDGDFINRDVEALIFNHKFAKAFFGIQSFPWTNWEPIWQYRLQELVIEEDPFSYLEEFL